MHDGLTAHSTDGSPPQSPPTPRTSNRTTPIQEQVIRPTTARHSDTSAEWPGWNKNHKYNTRFKECTQINLTNADNLPTVDQSVRTPVLDQCIAMISNIEKLENLDDGTSNFTYPSAFHNDMHHYGDRLQADDKEHFVTAMEDEVKGLQDMFQIIPRTPLPEGTKLLPAI
jgi:hypothetical protein